MKKISIFLTFIVGLIFIINSAVASTNKSYIQSEDVDSIETISEVEMQRLQLQSQSDSLTNSLISEVNDYIDRYAPKSKMTGEHIVSSCLESDFDITLLMAQAHLETHFGQANSRNNVFGLAKKRYSHPDSAVVDYISLMQRRYVKNRSVDEALASNLNVEGSSKYFYSELATYTNHVSSIRNKIRNRTNIETLFKEVDIINRKIKENVL